VSALTGRAADNVGIEVMTVAGDEKRPRELIERNSDPAEWGEKATHNAHSSPLRIAGESVSVSSLPRFGPEPDRDETTDVDRPPSTGTAR
jgi:hypothetical protein